MHVRLPQFSTLIIKRTYISLEVVFDTLDIDTLIIVPTQFGVFKKFMTGVRAQRKFTTDKP